MYAPVLWNVTLDNPEKLVKISRIMHIYDGILHSTSSISLGGQWREADG